MPTAVKRMDFSRFPRRTLPKDDTLFLELEESSELYVLLTGALGVYRDEVLVATIDEPLSVVGEISALTQKPRNATVRALMASTLVTIDDPEQLFEDYPQFASKLARTLAQRLALMNARFVELKGVFARCSSARLTDLGGATAGRTEIVPARNDPDWTMAAAQARVVQPVDDPVPCATSPFTGAPVPMAKVVPVDDVFNALADMLDWEPDAGSV